MTHQPHKIINCLRFGERLVSTLVSDHPHAGHLRALDKPVQGPQEIRRPRGNYAVRDVRGQVPERGHEDEICDEVVHRGCQASLEAVSRDGLLEVRELKRRPRQGERLGRLEAVGDTLFSRRVVEPDRGGSNVNIRKRERVFHLYGDIGVDLKIFVLL